MSRIIMYGESVFPRNENSLPILMGLVCEHGPVGFILARYFTLICMSY